MITISTIQLWTKVKSELVSAKKEESELRDSITHELCDPRKPGSTTSTIGAYVLKVTVGYDLKIDMGQLIALRDSLSDEEKACIKWVPEIKKREYNKLPENSVLRSIVAMKCGKPALAVEDLTVEE